MPPVDDQLDRLYSDLVDVQLLLLAAVLLEQLSPPEPPEPRVTPSWRDRWCFWRLWGDQ